MREIDILTKLKICNNETSKLLKNLDTVRSCKKIRCASCETLTSIKKLTLIQTHWYTEHFSCMGGDYWNQGELNYICSKCNTRNRLFFDNYDIEWEDRKKYEFDPERQFIRTYKHLFKKVLEEHDTKSPAGHYINNYYIDERRIQFGLVEKRKK